jgi:hypothetical protein
MLSLSLHFFSWVVVVHDVGFPTYLFFYPRWYVCTTICFVVLLGLVEILVRILHFRPISPCFSCSAYFAIAFM